MLKHFLTRIIEQRLDMCFDGFARISRDQMKYLGTNEIPAFLIEVTAIRIVHKRQRSIQFISTDQLCLGLNYATVPGFTFKQRLCGSMSFSYHRRQKHQWYRHYYKIGLHRDYVLDGRQACKWPNFVN